MPGLGLPEFFVFVSVAIRIAVVVWVIVTLQRMRGAQRALAASLQRIEQLLERR